MKIFDIFKARKKKKPESELLDRMLMSDDPELFDWKKGRKRRKK